MPEDIYWHNYQAKYRTIPVQFPDYPELNPDMIICIPSCAEPNLVHTLNSINQCHIHDISVAVIVLMNKNDSLSPEELSIHHLSLDEANKWIHEHDHGKIKYIILSLDPMADLKGGVGLARKSAMDEAARMLKPDGVIVCLDADCLVEPNYIREIFDGFHDHSESEAASIYFEHDLGRLDDKARNDIVLYELHLRYLVHAQRWCSHPFAYHTVGSSMAVRRNAYLSQGGMNMRSAGEDFYFLQKFIEINRLFEIKSTTVYPSARISYRVPFGTGRAMLEMSEGKEKLLTTNFESFRVIKPLFQSLPELRRLIAQESNEFDYAELGRSINLRTELIEYLKSIDFLRTVSEIYKHTNSLPSFQKRFFRYFNAFRMIRYTHYMRDQFFPDVPVTQAAHELLLQNAVSVSFNAPEGMLDYFRKKDKTGSKAKPI